MMKRISLLLALLVLLSSCSIGTREQNRANEDRNKAELASNKTDEHSSAARGTKVPKAFIPKESKYALDESTEVLIDAPIISKSNIKNYYKHGDHWHIFTWDGKEYITYKDPSKMSLSEQANLKDLGRETEKYSLRQIVEHIVKIYEKNGTILIKWKHVDHYHDSIYGLSEDIEGLLIEDAPAGYLPDPAMEIPSLVANKRYFRHGDKIYMLEGESQAEYREEASDKANEEAGEKAEKEHQAYSPSQIVANVEKIYMKKGLLMIRWLHIDHYHESAYGISEDIHGLLIERAPEGFSIDENAEIPSSVDRIRYFRAADRIYYIEDRQNEEAQEKEAPKEIDEKKDAESDIPGEEVVRNLEHISMKSSQLILYWLHLIPGNPHYHSSIYGISDDVKNVRIVEVSEGDVRGLQEISSSVSGKRYYRGEGGNADTVYCVSDTSSEPPSGGTSSSEGGASAGGSSEGGGSSQSDAGEIGKDAEREIPGAEIVANVESIYMKNGLVILKWLHKVPGHEHYHESAIGFHEDIKHVKVLDAPEGFVPKEELEISSKIPGKKYYRGTGDRADCIFVVHEKTGLFESVKESGDRVEVVYKGKKHLLFPLEYRIALKENRYLPNEESEIRIDPNFDEDRTIFLKEDQLDRAFDFWATWKRKDAEELREDGSTEFYRFRWYILKKNESEYKEIEVDRNASDTLEPEMYELSLADDGALLKIVALSAEERVLDEAKYLVKIGTAAADTGVSEETKEKIRAIRKLFIKNGELSIKWWHINHWHFEPVSWYGDLIIEKAPSNYPADPQKRIDELSLDQELLNRIHYIEEDRIYYIEVDPELFLSEKADEILRRRERFLSAASEEERVEFDYGERAQKAEILRFIELYEDLNDEAKANLSEKKKDLENILTNLSD